MKLVIGVVLFTSLAASSIAATCSYYRSSNQITCGGISCDTQANVDGGGKLPPGYYYIGEFLPEEHFVSWFNLYKQKADRSGFWDYHTQIPEENCRGGFGLHPGTTSLGCITVTTHTCFEGIKQVITAFPVIQFPVTECRVCGFAGWPICLWTNEISAPCTTDLQVYD